MNGTDATTAAQFLTGPAHFVAGVLLFGLGMVALSYLPRALAVVLVAVRYLATFHRAGVARVQAADTADARRRAREARRTVVTLDAAGNVAEITRRTSRAR